MVADSAIPNLKTTSAEQKRASFEAYAAIKTTSDVVVEYLRCKARFSYFLRYVRLPDVNKGLIKYELWGYLIEIADDWQTGDSWIEGKARQLGYSWLLAAYDCWIGSYRDHAKILSFSIDQRESTALLEKVKDVNRYLPDWLRREFTEESKTRVAWEGTGAEMVALPSTGKAGRGHTATLVQTDEWAFHDNAAEHYSAFRSAIADGGQHIAVSTGNGRGNLFYRYLVGENPELPYKQRFNGWRSRPDRDDVWYRREQAAFLAETLDESSEAFGKHPALFLRENPEDMQQMFQTFIGRVYDCFTAEDHELRVMLFTWQSAKWRVAAVDPGQGDPCAINIIGESEAGLAVIMDEFHREGTTTEDHIAEYLLKWHAIAPFHAIYVDYVEGTLIATLRARGLPVFPANKERGVGIGHVYGRLLAKNLAVAPGCPHTIGEFNTYRWLERGEPGDSERWLTSTPSKHHGDHMDAIRYALIGLAKMQSRAGTVPAPGTQPEWTNVAEEAWKRWDELHPQLKQVAPGQFTDPGPKAPSRRAGPDYRRRGGGGSRPNLAGMMGIGRPQR